MINRTMNGWYLIARSTEEAHTKWQQVFWKNLMHSQMPADNRNLHGLKFPLTRLLPMVIKIHDFPRFLITISNTVLGLGRATRQKCFWSQFIVLMTQFGRIQAYLPRKTLPTFCKSRRKIPDVIVTPQWPRKFCDQHGCGEQVVQIHRKLYLTKRTEWGT